MIRKGLHRSVRIDGVASCDVPSWGRLWTWIFIFVSVLLFLMVGRVHAATETISCNGSSRTLSVGSYVNTAGSTFSSGADLVLNQGSGACTLTFPSSGVVNLASLTVETGVTLTHSVADEDGIQITTTGNIAINSGGAMDVSAKGFAGGATSSAQEGNDGSGPGAGKRGKLEDTHNFWDGAGGGHGGGGGHGTRKSVSSDLGIAGGSYGNARTPITIGSGGGSGGVRNGGSGGAGGAGGGRIGLIIGGTLTLDGNIFAKGQDGSDADAPNDNSMATGGGGGAGGSILIDTDTIACTGDCGTLSAKGGAGKRSFYARNRYDWRGTYGGGGGGGSGRISVSYDTLGNNAVFTNADVNATGSGAPDISATPYNVAKSGEWGTLIFIDKDSRNAFIRTGYDFQADNLFSGAFKYDADNDFNNVTIGTDNGLVVRLSANTTITSNVDLSGSGTLYIACKNSSGHDLTINASGDIDLSSLQLKDVFPTYAGHPNINYDCANVTVNAPSNTDTSHSALIIESQGSIAFDLGATVGFSASTLSVDQGYQKGVTISNANNITLTDTDITGSVNWTVTNNLTIDADSSIDATGTGYVGGINTTSNDGAHGYGVDTDDDSNPDAGSTAGGGQRGSERTIMGGGGAGCGAGGHGKGKNGSYGSGGTAMPTVLATYATYDVSAPTYPGGGGASGGSFEANFRGGDGGAGGGVVTLYAPNTFTFNGAIIADGVAGSDSDDSCAGGGGGGGAGGSVYVAANVLNGSGTIRANGANGGVGNLDTLGAGGGGVGFISIVYGSGNYNVASDCADNCTLTAGTCTAGSCDDNGDGGTCTAYVEQDEHFGNNAPTANAGTDVTTNPGSFALNGSASSDADDGDSIDSYSWACTSCIWDCADCAEDGNSLACGTAVSASSGLTTATPSITMYLPTKCTFTLTVEDENEATDTDTVIATINDVAPIVTVSSASIDDGIISITASATDSNYPSGNGSDEFSYTNVFLSGPALGMFQLDEDGRPVIVDGEYVRTGEVDSITLSNATGTVARNTNFTMVSTSDVKGAAVNDEFRFRLRVTDSTGALTETLVPVNMDRRKPGQAVSNGRSNEVELTYAVSSWSYNADDLESEIAEAGSAPGDYTMSDGVFHGTKVGTYQFTFRTKVEGSNLSSADEYIEEVVSFVVQNANPDPDASYNSTNRRVSATYTDLNTDTAELAVAVAESDRGYAPTMKVIDDGVWEVDTDHPVPRGSYTATITATDSNDGEGTEQVTVEYPNNIPLLAPEDVVCDESAPSEINAGVPKFVREEFQTVELTSAFADLDLDNLAYSYKIVTDDDEDIGGFLETRSTGYSKIRTRKAGTITIEVKADDGYGAVSTQEIQFYLPPPNLTEDDAGIVLTRTARGDGYQQVEGSISSPVIPEVYINGVATDVTRVTDSSISVAKASGDDLVYELYNYSSNSIPVDLVGDDVGIEIFTDVDGVLVSLLTKDITSGDTTSSGDGGATGISYSVEGGAGCSVVNNIHSSAGIIFILIASLGLMVLTRKKYLS